MKNLLEKVYTKEEAEELLSEVERFEENLYRSGRRKPRGSVSERLKKRAEEQNINLKNVSEAKHFLEEIKKELLEIQTLSLSVAVTPRPTFVSKLSSQLKQAISPKIVLDIKVDPQVVGGAIISFNGRYRDLSLKRSLEKYFEENKKEILSKLG